MYGAVRYHLLEVFDFIVLRFAEARVSDRYHP